MRLLSYLCTVVSLLRFSQQNSIIIPGIALKTQDQRPDSSLSISTTDNTTIIAQVSATVKFAFLGTNNLNSYEVSVDAIDKLLISNQIINPNVGLQISSIIMIGFIKDSTKSVQQVHIYDASFTVPLKNRKTLPNTFDYGQNNYDDVSVILSQTNRPATIDLIPILKYLSNHYSDLQGRTITYIVILNVFMFGSGTVSVTQPRQIHFANKNIKYLLHDYHIFNYNTGRNLVAPEQNRLIISKGIQTIQDAMCKFNFVTQMFNSFQFVSVGYFQNEWLTPMNAYSLPSRTVNKKLTLLANFSFTESDTVGSSTIKAACLVIIIRSDYHEPTGKFTNPSQNPSYKIYICPWWSTAPFVSQQRGTKTNRKIVINQVTYEMYDGIYDISMNALKQLPPELKGVYMFVSLKQQLSVTNLDLTKFVEQTISYKTEVKNKHIVALQAGFIGYRGEGHFNFTEVSFAAVHPIYQNQNQQLTETVEALVSIPNIGLLFKISPFITIIDDLSYFAYHGVRYDSGFRLLSEICWDWTNSKWIPPQIIMEALHMNSLDSNSTKLINNTDQVTPLRFKLKNQDIFFLNNCKGYLLYTVPISTLMFLVFWKIYWKYKDYRLVKLIYSFRSWAYLFICLIGDNIQFLSFRCFQQLRFLIPNMGPLSIVCYSISLLVLFIAIICAAGLYLLIQRYAHKSFRLRVFKNSQKGLITLGLWLIGKLLFGFFHAFIDDSISRILGIASLQVLCTISTIYGSNKCQFRGSYAFIIIEQILRSILYILLTIEVMFPEKTLDSYLNEFVMSEISYILVLCLFGCVTLQLFVLLISTLLKNDVKQNQRPSKPQENIQAKILAKKNIPKSIMTVMYETNERFSNLNEIHEKNINVKKIHTVKALQQTTNLKLKNPRKIRKQMIKAYYQFYKNRVQERQK